MSEILVDTNILVYACDPFDTTRQEQALRVLDALQVSRSGRLSVQSLSEFISATTKNRRPLLTISEAMQQVDRLVQIFPVFDLSPMVVVEAARGVRGYAMSFYDAQIWAVARLNQVAVVFSEDFSDRRGVEGVRFVNPFASSFVLSDWMMLDS